VVPYRDRAAHLRQFVPHMLAYFQRAERDRYVAYSIHIVEQHGDARFNRGKLKNCGFALAAKHSDYVVFHDVDYLPLSADYSYSANPARLIWHGLMWGESYEKFFGGVVMFTPEIFGRINGYSNNYWGWGFEDTEMLLRLKIAGIDFDKRDGRFLALAHKNDREHADGTPSAEGLHNQALFLQRRKNIDPLFREDGINSLSYELVSSTNVRADGELLGHVYHHVVKI